MGALDEARLLVRVEATQTKIEKQMAAIAASAARQAKAAEDSFKGANDNIGKSFQRGERQAVASIGSIRSATTNLSFQLNDIAGGLLSGTSPFTIMAQQGGQTAQVMQQLVQNGGGAAGAMKALGGALMSAVSPVSLATYAIIGLGSAAVGYLMSLKKDVPDANEILKQHAAVIKGFDEVFGIAEKGAKKYSATIKTLEIQKLKDQYGDLEEAVKSAGGALADSIRKVSADDFEGATKSISDMNSAWRLLEKDQPDFKGFSAAMTLIENSQAPEAVRTMAKNFRLSAQESIPLQEAVEGVDERLRNVQFSGEAAKKIFESITAAALNLGKGGADGVGLIVDKITTDLIPMLATAASKMSDYFNNFIDLQRQINQTPLGTLAPLESGGGRFLNPAEAQDRRAAGTKSQFEQELEKASGAIDSFVDRVIKAESGGRNDAKNPNSSATGAGQFISSTWLALFRKYYPERAQSMGSSAILELRKDAEVSRSMIRAYAKENAAVLQTAGVTVTEAALQLSHFLGAGDAAKVLKAAPGTPLAGLISQASIKANPTILGGGKTVDDAISYAENRANAKAPAASRKTPEDLFKGSVDQIQKRIAVLNAEYEAQAKLNPLINDYGYAVEKAKIEAQLLTDAQKAGLEITPALSSNISALAENYAKATVSSGQLAEQNQKTVETMQESSGFGKDLLGGFISDLKAGKSASEAFSNALGKVADKLLEVSLNALFDGNKAGSGGGLLGGIFGSIGKILGFADGGYTGQGGKNQPAGVVHKGEYVFDKRATDRIGIRNLARLQKGYANGGYVGGTTPRIAAPSIPSASSSQGGTHITVGVSADNNGNLMPFVESVSERKAAQAARTGISQYDKQLDRSFGARMGRAQGRQL